MPRGRLFSRIMRNAAGLLTAAVLCLSMRAAAALSYYPPGPVGPIGVSRPTVMQQVNLATGERIRQVSMWLDGTAVNPVWDDSGLIGFVPPEPLSDGVHRIRMSVEVVAAGQGEFYEPIVSEFSFQVLPGSPEMLPLPGPEELRARQLVNAVRASVGLPSATYDPALGAAAAGHASYLAVHPMQMRLDPHHEQPETARYIGTAVGDRARHFGYSFGAAEVINFTHRAEDAVGGWMESLYHRIPLIHPGVKELGYGLAQSSDGPANVLVAGPMDETPGTVPWPFPGQVGVPTGWDGAETPNPFRLYPGVTGPVGYTITLTFGGRPQLLTLDSWSLNGPDGPVPVMAFSPSTDAYLDDTVALIPNLPLTPSTAYRVRLSGSIDLGTGRQAYDRSWSFSTASEPELHLAKQSIVTDGSRSLRSVTVDGGGFTPGVRVYLGGLPVEGLSLDSPTRLRFEPPMGFAGTSADLTVVSVGGQEVRWTGFLTEAQGISVLASEPAFKEVPLLVHGTLHSAPALRHRNGSVLLPASALDELGFQRADVTSIGRMYGRMGSESLEFMLGSTQATRNDRAVSLGLPVQSYSGQTYFDATLLEPIAGPVQFRSTGEAVLGISDIDSHWARTSIVRLLRTGLVSGSGNGRFAPDEALTRAAFIKMLVTARGLQPAPDQPGGFQDTAGHWVAQQGYIGTAVQFGIVDAADYTDRQFRPDQPITREEVAVMVVRALGLNAAALIRQVPTVGGASMLGGQRFIDANTWKRPGYIAIAVEEGIVIGQSEPGGGYKYRPSDKATRAEAAVMVVRAVDHGFR